MASDVGGVKNAPYLLFTLLISIFAIALLGASVFVHMDPGTRQLLDYADDALCALFFADFLISLRNAPNRWAYFIRWGWIDLLSCVPYVDYFRTGRVARIFRIFRVLRAIRSAKILTELILRRREQSAMLAATLIALVLIAMASIGILHFEDVPNANIIGPEDALWWTMETITTVGYGDKYPVTAEGRVLAAGVMIAGVGLIAMYTAALAAWFLRPPHDASFAGKPNALDNKSRERLLALRQAIDDTLLVDQPSSDPR
jgi:voltage-gated potassium channel